MPHLVSLLGALAVAITLGSAVPADHIVHEKRHYASPKWQKRDRVQPHSVVPVRIGLTQNNLHLHEELIMDVSHPHSPNYGKHWTQEEVIAKFAPSEETVEAVLNWLHSAGIDLDRVTHHDNKGWLIFESRMDELENLVHSEYHEYEHSEKGHLSIGCEHYHLPASVQPHIDYITPGIKFSPPLKKRNAIQKRRSGQQGKPVIIQPTPHIPSRAEGDLKNCPDAITPACIRALYDIPNTRPTINPNNSFGLYESGDFYTQGDLNRFFTTYSSFIPNGTKPILNSVDGGEAPVPLQEAGVESNLDFMMAYPILYPQKLTLFQVDDAYYSSHFDIHNGIFNTWLDAMDGSYCQGKKRDTPIDPIYPDPHKGGYKGKRQCGVYEPSKVISISYGVQEDDLPESYQKRQCMEFMKLGLQGVSFFGASGDTGVAGIDHFTQGGCLGKNGTIFNPTQPNSCPYITNVGGTQLNEGSVPSDGEVAVSQGSYTSSGGFSNIFPRPSYQDDAIQSYYQKHKPPYRSYNHFGLKAFRSLKGVYNRPGRGIPDVAANGKNLAIYAFGSKNIVGGTSGSSPIFAAIVSRINNERLNAGKSVVGFINPAIYMHPEIFNDITVGNNPGCGTNGFKAVKGWDPVTGLGTPSYPKLLEMFMNLP